MARRGLVSGVLTAGGAAGQLVFLPVVALVAESSGWRAAALGVSVAVGLLFGVGPARSASRLDPVEALRQE